MGDDLNKTGSPQDAGNDAASNIYLRKISVSNTSIQFG